MTPEQIITEALDSYEAGKISWPEIQDIARGTLGNDPGSYRAEFLTLIEKVKVLGGDEAE